MGLEAEGRSRDEGLMRITALLLFVLLSACQKESGEVQEPAVSGGPELMTYVGHGRDRLCLDERAGRIGLISYGKDNANCSLRGTVTRAGPRLTIAPDGDETCRLTASMTGESLSIVAAETQCAFYCGPGASLSGSTFRRSGQAVPVTDLAGEPLC
jgi:hypothetical protein